MPDHLTVDLRPVILNVLPGVFLKGCTMSLFRSVINFPAIFHMKCTEEMKAQIHAHGGAGWVRAIIKANMAAPLTTPHEPGDFAPAVPGNTPATTRRRKVTRGRVDKRKGRKVK